MKANKLAISDKQAERKMISVSPESWKMAKRYALDNDSTIKHMIALMILRAVAEQKAEGDANTK